MIQVLIAWVFFRAENIGQAFQIIKTMFSFSTKLPMVPVPGGMALVAALVLFECMIFFKVDLLKRIPMRARLVTGPVLWGLAIAAIIFFRGPGSTFIYFQF
jgi:hypothetical protein